ncbi:MAG: flippase-like domain-containing protein [Bacteroidia bacterium]|nr:flippase-like domain-containing protein [Bacteroidia bacterium]
MFIGQLPYKTKQFFFLLIKLSIVSGAFYFIHQKLTTNELLDFKVFLNYIKEHQIFSAQNIVFLLLLTSFNWVFEILKWKNLVSVVTTISFFEALKQSLASLTASLFTPNRIGEYGVKAVYFKKVFRKRIMLLNLFSNIAQMTVTVTFGIIGFTFFYLKYDTNVSLYRIARFLTIAIIIGSFLLVSSKYSKFKIRGFPLEKIKIFLSSISISNRIKTVALSVLRYLVFSFQFFYLLKLFGIDVNYYNAMLVICSFYVISSIIPTIFILDIIVKGSIALFLFEIVGVNSLTTLSVITLMWVLNFVIPSFIGSLFVLGYDYRRINISKV